jgi:hypothetical protein
VARGSGSSLPIVETVPFWFHRFALNRAEGIFSPLRARPSRPRLRATRGLRRDKRARCRLLRRLLRRPRRAPGRAETVVAVDNEPYRLWVASRWAVELEGGWASEPFIDCSARRLSIDGWRVRARPARGALRLRVLLRHPAKGREFTRAAAACYVGARRMAARCWSRPTVSARKIETARRSASPSPGRSTRATSSSTRGSGPPACSGLPGLSVLARRVARRCGGRRPPAHHRSAGRVQAPGLRSQQPLHQNNNQWSLLPLPVRGVERVQLCANPGPVRLAVWRRATPELLVDAS